MRPLPRGRSETVDLGLLADGGDDGVGFDFEFGTRARHRPRPPGGIRLAEIHADATQGHGNAIFLNYFYGRGEVFDLDALFERAFDLRLDGRHFSASAAI